MLGRACTPYFMSNPTSGKLTWTILSISLLTVMAGAAIAPALGIIKEHFSSSSDITLQLIISLPALFIIIANLFFPNLCSIAGSKTLALCGLVLYVLSGACCFFVDNIVILLILRALLGISVGIVMPLSTGLLSYYYPPEQQAKLMGLSAAMNQMGGVVATLLAGLLSQIGWNFSFLVYLLGLIAVVLVALFLPEEHLKAGKEAASTVMPLLSSALYLGQFISPLIVTPLAGSIFGGEDLLAPYKIGIAFGIIYLLQSFFTRKKQATGQ